MVLERPAGSIVVLANPGPGSGLFVWVTGTSIGVVAEPDTDTALDAAEELTVCSGRLVVGAPGMVAAWGADVDTGDGSGARAEVHRAGPAWASSSSVGPRSAEGRCQPVPAPRP